MLVVDNGSVYTPKLIDLLNNNDISFDVTTPIDIVLDTIKDTIKEHDTFILSGRRNNDRLTNQINSKIITHAVQSRSKLLGICYGAEILALTLGGTIHRTIPHKGDNTIHITQTNPISNGTLQVFESHSYEISTLPDMLIPLACSDICRYEIVQYRDQSIFGTQFHPEMSDDGQDIIMRFCKL